MLLVGKSQEVAACKRAIHLLPSILASWDGTQGLTHA